jgi:hypothetical protein
MIREVPFLGVGNLQMATNNVQVFLFQSRFQSIFSRFDRFDDSFQIKIHYYLQKRTFFEYIH